jgi:pimeloyl-ACP methyl ester carboxylesterase
MRIVSDGVGLNVEVDGPDDGTPVVFLHGVSGSGRTFEWLGPELAHRHRVVRLDLRGHGRSEHAAGTYDIDRYGEDVVAVLRQLVDRPAVLVGHSLGAVTAWWVAQRHPELVAAAFLEDPPLYMGEPAEHARNAAVPAFRVMRDAAARWQAEGATAEAVAAQLTATPFAADPARSWGDVVTQDALAARADALLRMDPGVLDGATDRSTLADTDTESPLAVPVFLLAADDASGSAFPARHAERLARTHPDVQVARVAGAGHSIHDEREHRPAYLERLTAFLEQHAPAATSAPR